MRLCDYEGCDRRHLARGWCTLHYYRLSKGRISTPEYHTWTNMKQRCYNKNTKDYIYYGGRGITVCERWVNSYDNFLEDMGKKPTPKHSIDRTDNDKGYSPENCTWVTFLEQMHNQRPKKNNTGHTGICAMKNGKYLSRIGQRYIGTYETIEEAIMKREEALAS